MEIVHSKYQRMKSDCEAALAQALPEKCLQILEESLDERDETIRNTWIALSSRLNELKWQQLDGVIGNDDYIKHRNNIRKSLQDFINILKPENVSLLRRTHDRILICTYPNSATDWENLFPTAFFSHAAVIFYKAACPPDYQAPDVVIFDDSDHNPIDVRLYMTKYLKEMPQTHFLYFGDENPFKTSTDPEGKAVWNRCNNANTRFTVHARLRELLEYRKIYGTPKNT